MTQIVFTHLELLVLHSLEKQYSTVKEIENYIISENSTVNLFNLYKVLDRLIELGYVYREKNNIEFKHGSAIYKYQLTQKNWRTD